MQVILCLWLKNSKVTAVSILTWEVYQMIILIASPIVFDISSKGNSNALWSDFLCKLFD